MKCYALVPAAGRSARMGQPKLLMPWGESTIIETVLATWLASGVAGCAVTVHPADDELAQRCRKPGVEVVTPASPPVDMQESVALAAERIETLFHPQPDDAWLLAPADMPGLSQEVIAAVVAAFAADRTSAVAPSWRGRRGHPVAFPWDWTAELRRPSDPRGIHQLFRDRSWLTVEWPSAEIWQDVDRPADYRNLRNRHSPRHR